MRLNCLPYCIATILYLGSLSCANISAPTGGNRDTEAPRIVRSNLKDSMLNFKEGKLEFEFDEFIQLKDVQNQLVISPLLASKPKITSHKRKVTVYLPDTMLRRNTTYTLSFGNAIQDIHEGNPIKDLNYTFSTGAYLDTLMLEGKVVNAKTGLADTAAWVGLYNVETADSDFVLRKPLYQSRVQNGVFRIKNLPNKNYAIFALNESNSNLRYDSVADAMAFYPNTVSPSSSEKITLFLFKEEGQVFDSLKGKPSTLRGPIRKVATAGVTVNVDTTNKTKRTFDLNDTLRIQSDIAFKLLDKTRIRLYQDSILDATVKMIEDTNKHTIMLATEWSEEANYTLTLSDGFAKDSAGKEIKGGVFKFKTKRQSDYGFIKILQAIEPNRIVYVYNQNNLIYQTKQTDSVITLQRLLPGEYRIEILHDDNGNGRWDTGKFFPRRMPEIMERFDQSILVKANWENKIDLRKPSSSSKK